MEKGPVKMKKENLNDLPSWRIYCNTKPRCERDISGCFILAFAPLQVRNSKTDVFNYFFNSPKFESDKKRQEAVDCIGDELKTDGVFLAKLMAYGGDIALGILPLITNILKNTNSNKNN